MPEFFSLLPPDQAREKFFAHLPIAPPAETLPLTDAFDRVTLEAVHAPHALPAFARSSMDGYAVRAQDTFGAGASLPAYLTVTGEVLMGRAPTLTLGPAEAALIHTGGMLPAGADAVVMIEQTQKSRANEIEILKATAPGENVIQVGDDIQAGAPALPAGRRLRAQDIGGLAALGITHVTVARRPRVALLSTGDEIVPPETDIAPGQVRDTNSYTTAAQVARAGGMAVRCGIVPDDFKMLLSAAQTAFADADMLVISAGSSVSVRDLTADVINQLGRPGVLVHGIAVKPGKPALLAVADGKAVFGLPGNPVSAIVITELFIVPTIYRWQGSHMPPRPTVRAKLARNIASQAGRTDYVPVRLTTRADEQWAEPIFGKSNQIFTLVHADGLAVIPADANGASAGENIEVKLFE